jgi:hypothetical protein
VEPYAPRRPVVQRTHPQTRIALLADLDQLATHPFRDGHFRYADSDNREIRVWVRDDLMIHYWLDHAVREVRVNRIESAEPI